MPHAAGHNLRSIACLQTVQSSTRIAYANGVARVPGFRDGAHGTAITAKLRLRDGDV